MSDSEERESVLERMRREKKLAEEKELAERKRKNEEIKQKWRIGKGRDPGPKKPS